MKVKIENPILPGFNPDPSIICVGSDYYIATSTFEWFPGVQIHHSKDLIHWELITRPLNSVKLLDMAGESFSDGVWAPCLSYWKGTYYLVYTNVRSSQVYPFKDTPNYLTTAPDITGPWSEPVYLNSSGFDPSMFHDEDGRKWIVNMEWDYRKKGNEQFSGILLQEYDEKSKRLIGEVTKITKGTNISVTEGPHLYKKGGYYYLMLAEGGTSYQHAVTLMRSKSIDGPYEVHPHNPLLTAWDGGWPYKYEDIDKNVGKTRLKKAGHGSMCQGADGRWYLVHLCGRPVGNSLFCILGRETAIQELEWKKDDWCYLKNGGNKPQDYIEVENASAGKSDTYFQQEYLFYDDKFLKDFQTLRTPYNPEYMSIHKRKGFLTLRGRESIYSRFYQTLLARRQTDFNFEAVTILEYEPKSFMHMAGLIYRYSEENQYYLFMSYDEDKKSNTINVIQVDDSRYSLLEQVLTKSTRLELSLCVNGLTGQFYYKEDEEKKKIGPEIETKILSDEYAKPMGFTGAFIGMCAQDLQRQENEAYFEKFIYIKK